MRIAKSTLRVDPKAREGQFVHDDAENAARAKRQDQLNLIAGSGCMTCTVPVKSLAPYRSEPDGSRISCPLLAKAEVAASMAKGDRERAAACAIPDLYAKVFDGKHKGEVTEAQVVDLCPFLEAASAPDAAEASPAEVVVADK